MNRRIVIGRLLVTGTVVVAIGLLLVWGRGRLNPSTAGFSLNSTAPAKIPREKEDSEYDRELAKLSPRLRQIARRLADAANEEGRQLPPHEHGYLTDKRWTAFARKQIEALDTADVAALAAGLHGNFALEDLIGDNFRGALFFVWGARDSAAARAHVMRVAEDLGYRRDQSGTWENAGNDMVTDYYVYLTQGHASIDPVGAWTIFQREVSDPAMAHFGHAYNGFHDIFRAYAAKAPEEAWKILISQDDLKALDWALFGFFDGAPPGQDWQKLGEEWEGAIHVRGKGTDLDSRLQIAARWVMEDPAAALAWIGSTGEIEDLREMEELVRFDDGHEVPPLPGLEGSDDATDLKLALLSELFGSREYRVPETVEVLRTLASGGQADLAARFIHKIRWYLSPSDLELLKVLPAIDDAPLREALFLQMARAVPPRGEGLLSSDMTLDEPNVYLDAVKEIAGKLDLSEAVRAQAEAAFAEVEAKEATKRATSR